MLPLTGPATLTGAKAHLSITPDDTGDDTFITGVVGAVNSLVRQWRVCDAAKGSMDWSEEHVAHIPVGANMLAARLVRRRESPDGVAVFGEQGPLYVQRNDPDIALLLQLGAHARPQAR